jgi:hypothetical protein
MQKKEKKKLKKLRVSNIFLIVLVMLLILLGVLLWVQFHDKKSLKEPKLFVIEDKCSVMFNTIMHVITDEGKCRLSCRYECEIRDLKISLSEFIESNNSCHTCNCYCI